MMSASSTIPFLIACRSSPALGSWSSTKTSTMPATVVSDWPTPTVSTMITSKPAASHTSIASRVFSATPPSEPPEGDGRMNELRLAREPLHPRLVAQDRAAGDGAGRVHRQHRDPVALADEVQAQGLDERRLADARASR